MRIALVLPYLKAGGTERQASYIANYLKREGHEVVVISVEKKGSFEDLFDTKIKYLGIPFRKINFPKIIYGIRRYVKNNKFDVIVNRAWSAHIISGTVSLLTNIPLVTFLSGAIKFQNKNFVKRQVHNFYLKRADKIISVSEASKENCKKCFDVKESQLEVVHNGIDIEQVREASLSEIQSIDYSEIGESSYKILFMGRLIPRKGLDILLKAVVEMNTGKEVKVLVLGKGPKLADYKRMVNNFGIKDKVKFLGQKVNPFPYLAMSDLFVLPSREEGFPNALLEGMALGKPVIAADCDNGPREIIDGMNGTLIPVGDSKTLAEAIKKYLNNKQLANNHGKNAYLTIKENFLLDSQLRRIENIILNTN
ncbi:MAG: glycosyltransferase [Bacteroidota bacterium]